MKTADFGVLLDKKQLLRALQGNYGFEYLPNYISAAKQAGMKLVFFSDHHIDGELTEAYLFNSRLQSFQEDTYKLPKIIHNRTLLHRVEKPHVYEAAALVDARIFNRLTRFSKSDVHTCLNEDETLRPYLLKTSLLRSVPQIRNWVKQYRSIYLKPCNGSLGLGVMRLALQSETLSIETIKNRVHCYNQGWTSHELNRVLRKNQAKPYLIQEAAHSISLQDRPIDFRVTVQKGEDGNWNATGLAARIGIAHSHVTNLSLGGTALPAREILEDVYGSENGKAVSSRLRKAGTLIAKRLEKLDADVADLGLDLAVTKDGSIKFIEANGRDLRITYRDSQQYEMWRSTFRTPVLYAQHLLYLGEEDEQRNENKTIHS